MYRKCFYVYLTPYNLYQSSKYHGANTTSPTKYQQPYNPPERCLPCQLPLRSTA